MRWRQFNTDIQERVPYQFRNDRATCVIIVIITTYDRDDDDDGTGVPIISFRSRRLRITSDTISVAPGPRCLRVGGETGALRKPRRRRKNQQPRSGRPIGSSTRLLYRNSPSTVVSAQDARSPELLTRVAHVHPLIRHARYSTMRFLGQVSKAAACPHRRIACTAAVLLLCLTSGKSSLSLLTPLL